MEGRETHQVKHLYRKTGLQKAKQICNVFNYVIRKHTFVFLAHCLPLLMNFKTIKKIFTNCYVPSGSTIQVSYIMNCK